MTVKEFLETIEKVNLNAELYICGTRINNIFYSNDEGTLSLDDLYISTADSSIRKSNGWTCLFRDDSDDDENDENEDNEDYS